MFDAYLDSGLTTPMVGNFLADQHADGSSDPVQFQFWVGDSETGITYDVESDPGVDPILISFTDIAPGSGHEVTEVKLALTQAGLATAVAGDPLNIGTEITSGPAGAVEVWMEVDDATLTYGTNTELGIETPVLRKIAA